MIVFLLSKKSRKIFPFNYILLLIFYLLLGFTTAAASTYEGDKVVLMVFGIALGTMITLTIYSFLKRENIVISIGIVIVIIFAIILFILLIVFIGADKISILIICPFSVIYYGIFVILETKIIIEKNIFGTDYNDYIVAVIYVDSKIISTFTIIEIACKRVNTHSTSLNS
jgi:FtsH-binding integral membrane protein